MVMDILTVYGRGFWSIFGKILGYLARLENWEREEA